MAAGALAVIPARLASSRFPGKMLASETGRPLIAYAIDAARRAACVGRVVIAADDASILDAGAAAGAEPMLTRADHPNGSSRIAEVVERLGSDCPEFVVNVQGDEPDLDPGLIDAAVSALDADPHAVVGTIASPLTDAGDQRDPNIVKVVRDRRGRALYFSRAAIPFHRVDAADATGTPPAAAGLRHVGLYVYRRDFLATYAALAPTPLEETERLEQLRMLEAGFSIAVAVAESSHGGIDTPAQYAAFVARERAAGRVPTDA